MCKLTFPWQAFCSQWFKERPFVFWTEHTSEIWAQGWTSADLHTFYNFLSWNSRSCRRLKSYWAALRLVYGYIALARSLLYWTFILICRSQLFVVRTRFSRSFLRRFRGILRHNFVWSVSSIRGVQNGRKAARHRWKVLNFMSIIISIII